MASLKAARDQRSKLVDGAQEIMVMADMPNRRETFMLSRGAYDQPTEPVTARTPNLPPLNLITPID